ncbi:MAG: phage tail assembly chaperone [Novosphingobium sp.]|nr:phage tail assembly chaperone [Novosphingobium sp.]
MSDSFGPHAVRLFTLAAKLLGWRPADFWSATPAELAAALAPLADGTGDPLARTELEKMMERENG